ncbi:hypothetical protein BLOT_004841, partial [Blomia tropicalis]
MRQFHLKTLIINSIQKTNSEIAIGVKCGWIQCTNPMQTQLYYPLPSYITYVCFSHRHRILCVA